MLQWLQTSQNNDVAPEKQDRVIAPTQHEMYYLNLALVEEDLTAGALASLYGLSEHSGLAPANLQSRLRPKHNLSKCFWQKGIQKRWDF